MKPDLKNNFADNNKSKVNFHFKMKVTSDTAFSV